ncbi:rhodanese-like domain-containing protein [Anaerococcus sp. DFU013_CI05]|uniref:rhodanese-like domain-containing protein n=1 Tax=Anaerococcus sp. AH8042_DFU013_CI05 TaxID=3385202 RepID=UPI003A521EE9
MKNTNKLLTLMLIGTFVLTACGNNTSTAPEETKTEDTTSTETTSEDNNKSETSTTDEATTDDTAKDNSETEVKTITGEELDKIQEDNDEKEKYLVIDTRKADAYKEGHVKHAITLPADELAERIDELADSKDKNVVVYGETTGKAEEAYKTLVDNGFTNVKSAGAYRDFDYTTKTKVTSVSGPEFIELAKTGDYTIVDVRDEKDYNKGHLAGAINVPVDQTEELIKTLPTDKPFLTHCYSGNRSFKVADMLANEGHEVINALDGTKEYDGYDLSEN